jgi:Permuted papain-like amidase enzyme, YaeF/YiiX, C92 family
MKAIIYLVAFMALISIPMYFFVFMATDDRNVGTRHIDSEEFWEYDNGDLIFQISQSRQCKAVQLATGSDYSHMGIIYKTKGKYFVYEAVGPVKLTRLDDWIKHGKNNHYVVKRLSNADEIFTKQKLNKLKAVGEKYKNKSYDKFFEWSDKRIYCSELVWKMYKEAMNIEIGELQNLGDFDLSHDLVKKIMSERYGDKIPFDEKVISPGDMFDSDLLMTVYEN